MGRGPRKLTVSGWEEFLVKKTDQQLYWWIRHGGYTRDYLKQLLIDADVTSESALNGLSILEIINAYKVELISCLVDDFSSAW